VSVRRSRDGGLSLATNGKPDASLGATWLRPDTVRAQSLPLTGDAATQALLPIITLAHAPRARQVAVIGHGSGMTSHFFLGSPHLERLATIEIEPEMLAAARQFMPANRRVYEDRRSEFVVDDAKSYFAASRRTYDIILSEPSNPWVSGVSGLFTREFYARVKDYLAPGGVFAQWLHLYEIDDGLVMSVLAAIDEEFPAYEIFLTESTDMVVVASATVPQRAPDWSVVEYPSLRADLRHVVPLTPEAFERMRLTSRGVLHPLLATSAAPNSDFYPVLDLGTERTRFLRLGAVGIGGMAARRFDIGRALEGRRARYGTLAAAPTPGIVRVRELALSTQLRAALGDRIAGTDSVAPPRPTPATPRPGGASAAHHRAQRFLISVRSSFRVSNWALWLAEFASVEEDLHGGASGVADEAFYGEVFGYLRTVGAPAPAVAAVELLHGLAAWDWPQVKRSAALLAAEAKAGRPWVSSEELRNGAVVAHLLTGDVAGARRAFDQLSPAVPAEPGARFRGVLLDAHVRALEGPRNGAGRGPARGAGE
jgi:spermidine synthase